MTQNTENVTIPDCDIDVDKYRVHAVGGAFTELWIDGARTESLLDFFEGFADREKLSMDYIVKKMQAEGVGIEHISSQLISELKSGTEIKYGYMYDCSRSVCSELDTPENLKYEPRYGISRGLFYLAKQSLWFSSYELEPALRSELLRMLSKCNTRNDLTGALQFVTLADDSPVLRYILQRTRGMTTKEYFRKIEGDLENHEPVAGQEDTL